MNAIEIFDSIGRLAQLSVIYDQKRLKVAQIRELELEVCGNCNHWMKTSCKPEKEQKQFKSCSSIACCDFVRKGWVEDMTEQRKKELEEIECELNTILGQQ